jgi:SAM-dependent methyltransferase
VPRVGRQDVIANYATEGLAEAVLERASRRAGGEPLTAQHLGSFDQFHQGGPVATGWVADALQPAPGATVLDVGCGFGGPARQLAATTDAGHVTGVDLTPQHVDGATRLSRAVGLRSATTFVLGDATRMPFGGGAFDAAVMLFVGMNVEDKPRLFAEVHRVLQPGGRFVLYDPMLSGQDQPAYPMPWAPDREHSNLVPREEYVGALQSAGFAVDSELDWTDEVVRLADQQDPELNDRVEIGRLQFGDQAVVRFQNLVRAVRDGVVQPRMVVATAR